MKKFGMFGLATALCILFASATASAADYPCRVSLGSYDGAYGDFGYVYVEWYSGANCSGNYVGSDRYCSTGATSSSCSSASYCIYNDPEMLAAMYEALADSAREGSLVDYSTSSCIGGGSGCGCYTYIR